MTIDQFLNARLTQIARLTGIGVANWNQYIYKEHYPGYRFLTTASARLEMSIDDLISAIQLRRKQVELERSLRAEVEEMITASGGSQ